MTLIFLNLIIYLLKQLFVQIKLSQVGQTNKIQSHLVLSMSSRQKAPLVQSSPNKCNCCPNCKSRISRLEIMINQLFSYVSDYLPEELNQIKQPESHQHLQQEFGRNQLNMQHRTSRIDKAPKNDRYKAFQPTSNKDYNIGSLNRGQFAQNDKTKRAEGRKIYAPQQKKSIVMAVQDAMKKGQTINDACARMGICDRSYQRWKKDFQLGNIDKESSVSISSTHLTINNYNV